MSSDSTPPSACFLRKYASALSLYAVSVSFSRFRVAILRCAASPDRNVRGVTTAGVLRAAKEHLHPDRLRVLVVGDPAVVSTPLSDVTGMNAEVVAAADAEAGA